MYQLITLKLYCTILSDHPFTVMHTDRSLLYWSSRHCYAQYSHTLLAHPGHAIKKRPPGHLYVSRVGACCVPMWGFGCLPQPPLIPHRFCIFDFYLTSLTKYQIKESNAESVVAGAGYVSWLGRAAKTLRSRDTANRAKHLFRTKVAGAGVLFSFVCPGRAINACDTDRSPLHCHAHFKY